MTYIEQLRADHPEWSEYTIGYNVGDKCPGDFGYDEQCITGEGWGDDVCLRCWEQECPVAAEKNITSDNPNDLVDIAMQAARVREAFDDAMGIESAEPHIKDSGDRTQFESGAVRDMREGKGRCDLMALEVVGNYICDEDNDTDHILWNLRQFQTAGSTSYLYSAMHIFELEAYDDQFTMFLEVAKHFEEGAKKYGESNWQKGIPVHCYIDSAVRHYLKYKRGDKDEPHDRAFIWNLMCCIWEVDYGEEWRKKKEEP